MKQKEHLVITISRELGSGGAYIGQQLAQKLNMYYADHGIIAKAAEQLSAVIEEVASQDEKTETFWKSFWLYSGVSPDAYMPTPRKFSPTSFDVFNAEANVIKRIAKDRPSVIIGRCGFHVLRDHLNCVRIFLHGNADFRARRIQEQYHISKAEAEKMIAQSDKERTHYIGTFTGKKWSDAKQYDLCIDTSKIGVDKSADLILKYLTLA